MVQLKIWQANIIYNIMQHVLALEDYYSRQAAKCPDLVCTSFLVYVASEKTRQIEKLQELTGINGTDFMTGSKVENPIADVMENLSDKTLDEISEYVKELSIRDLKMYAVLSNRVKEFESIFSALIDIEEGYMARVESGYRDHLSIGLAKIYQYENKIMQLT